MKDPTKIVSVHPYFKVHPGKLDAAKSLLRVFVERTATEDKCLCYDFTINGDEVFCREAYEGADGFLTHLANVTGVLGEFLKISDLARLEVHGPAAELEKLKAPMAEMKPDWFVYECGVHR